MLNTMVAGSEEVAAQDLTDAFGGHVPVALQEAREALRASAAALAQEVDVNRRVLREALATGDEYMRRLTGSGETPRVDYPTAAGGKTPAARPGGLVLDRTV
jgi:hypothetical protein